MKQIPFSKYHGTGNDFVIVDHREVKYLEGADEDLIRLLCDRRFGIGGDGLMIIEAGDEESDFTMAYYNADGAPSSMCGNGGRCISIAAGIERKADHKILFKFDGNLYESHYDPQKAWVSLKMQDVTEITVKEDSFELDTGSPHNVRFVEEVNDLDVKMAGAEIRYSPEYHPYGINVNFCSWSDHVLTVRTYERGVEDETYSCGTGVVASSIALCQKEKYSNGRHQVQIQTLGGKLRVQFLKSDGIYSDITLHGPAVKVFNGVFTL